MELRLGGSLGFLSLTIRGKGVQESPVVKLVERKGIFLNHRDWKFLVEFTGEVWTRAALKAFVESPSSRGVKADQQIF
jgi:hypothetical protein